MTTNPTTTTRQDAAKRRREYLVAQVGLKMLGYGAALVIVFCVFRLGWNAVVWILEHAEGWTVAVSAILGVIYMYTMVGGVQAILAANSKAESLPYVPPVAEQLANLPADAVLLRGSNEPAASSGELLRAADQASETAPDELLRPMGNKTA